MNWRYEIIEEARDRVMAKRIVSAIEKLFKRDRVLFEIDTNGTLNNPQAWHLPSGELPELGG